MILFARSKFKVLFFIQWLCIAIFLLPPQLLAITQASPIVCENQQLIFQADQLPIKDVLQVLHNQCGIIISGLKLPEDYPLTYHAKGPVLEIIKRLLRYLQAESYAFEFNGDQLSHVLIFSKGTTKNSLPPALPNYTGFENKNTINVVKVLDIVPDSQAEVHGFQKGDLIIEYDSVPIQSASQLVSEVQKKKNLQRVDLVIVRNKSRQTYVINSGLIGVRIQTVRIPEGEIK
ncbi:MAG: PDZ domain-containing protein [Candidatus Magnetomorum sp.]|nr:PDZ domain-containing protein [Candidatus Magnetomorum sp.]